MPVIHSRLLAASELILAGMLWGFGYVAAKWALEGASPEIIVIGRFLLASLGGWMVFWWCFRGTPIKKDFFLSAFAGLSLGIAIALQTVALQYTSVARCGFLTGLYVVFVPLLEWLILHRSISRWIWLWVGVAILGTALMCGVHQDEPWNIGDALSLGCAGAAAFQIFFIGRASAKIHHAFGYNIGQNFWAILPGILLGFISPTPMHFNPTLQSVVGLVILGIGCSLIAFWLQVRSQKILSLTLVSMFFLLESPFGAFFGHWFLGELLNTHQLMGAALIFIACYQTVKLER